MKTLHSIRALLMGGVAILGTTACSPTENDAAGQQAEQSQAAPNSAATESDDPPQHQATSRKFGQREESWMSWYKDKTKIGYSYTIIEPANDVGADHLRLTSEQELSIKRFQRETAVIRTKLTSLETSDGQLLAFHSEMVAGGGPMETDGKHENGKLVMHTTSDGTVETHSIPFDAEFGGFFSDQLSLRKQPMKPRETRRLKALQPIVNQVAEIRLEAVGYEATELLNKTQQLLRIDMSVDIGGAKLKSTLWADGEGTVHKLRDLQMGMEAYLTSREEALTESQGGEFDLGLATVVSIKQRIKNPHATKQIVYRARLTEGEIEPLLSSGGSQRIKSLDEHTAEVTVRALRPNSKLLTETPESDRPREADLASTAMLQCKAPVVVEMAGTVAPNEGDSWVLACALEKLVQQSITMKNYSRAMATASEVAKSREGDCTEHAMLLAALCRARKIPARVAIGLVYYPAVMGFAYHMWTEVWIADRWIPMDATLGQGGIGAAHLKLSHSSLEGSAAFAEMLPVIQAVGRLKLEILAVEY